jgi:hypothetical protein
VSDASDASSVTARHPTSTSSSSSSSSFNLRSNVAGETRGRAACFFERVGGAVSLWKNQKRRLEKRYHRNRLVSSKPAQQRELPSVTPDETLSGY